MTGLAYRVVKYYHKTAGLVKSELLSRKDAIRKWMDAVRYHIWTFHEDNPINYLTLFITALAIAVEDCSEPFYVCYCGWRCEVEIEWVSEMVEA